MKMTDDLNKKCTNETFMPPKLIQGQKHKKMNIEKDKRPSCMKAPRGQLNN